MTASIKNIETQNLFLESLSLKHKSINYVDWINDIEVNKYLEVKGGYTLERLENFLEEVEKKKVYFWAIIIKDSLKHIGNIKIDPINFRHGFAEYGIMMGDKEEWGKGYAKEASKGVIEFCFNELNLRKICLGVVEDNQSAVNLYYKLGFKLEGKYLNHVIYDDVQHNVLRMSLFKNEYGQ